MQIFLVVSLFINTNAFAYWKVGSCMRTFGYSAEVQNWRTQAIATIRKGLSDELNPHAVVDMSPFIPENLDAEVAKLPHGLVGLYRNVSERSLVSNSYLTEDQLKQIPPHVWKWTLEITEFVSDLIKEARRPEEIAPQNSPSIAKVAIGGTAHVFTDKEFHVDTSFLSMVLNAVGDIGTVYLIKSPTPEGSNDDDFFITPAQQLARNETRRAPPKSLIIFSGREFYNRGYGAPLEHRAPDKPGLSYRIIRFFSQPY